MSSTKTEQVQKAPLQTGHEQIGKVVVPAPDEQNKQIEVAISMAAKVQLDFDPGTANAERVGNNLVFTFDDGKKITLVDFFVTEGHPLPALELPGGTEVASAQILAALNPDMDLTTAAGPGAKSGGTSYADDPGNLLDGIDRLGSLGTDQWGNTTNTPLVEPTIRLLTGPAPVAPSFLENGEGYRVTLPESDLPGGNVDTLTVLSAGTQGSVSFLISSANGLSSVTIEGNTYAIDQVTGQLILPSGGVDDAQGTGKGHVTGGSIVPLGNGQFTLTLNYELLHPVQHSQQGEDTLFDAEVYSLYVTTPQGLSSPVVELHVNVVDDVPLMDIVENQQGGEMPPEVAAFGRAFSFSVQEAPAEPSANLASGTINIAYGADGKGGDVEFKIGDGAFTTIVFNTPYTLPGAILTFAQGEGNAITYHIVRSNPTHEDINVVTPLTIKAVDGDGDIVTGTINVSVDDRGIIITDLDAGKELLAFEKRLDIVQDGSPYEGTHDDDALTWTHAKTFTFTTGDGFGGLTIDGVNVPLSASSLDIAGDHGTLQVMGIVQTGDTYTVTYRYHLTENADHSTGPVKDSFEVQVTDMGAETRTASLDVAIVDNRPVATDDVVHLGLNTLSVSGSVLTGVVAGTLVPSGDADKYGADGPADEGSLRFHDGSIRFTSALGGVEPLTYDETTHLLTDSLGNAYGTLVLNSDGTYSYTRPVGIEHEGILAVRYTIIDGDGDKSRATLSIDVAKLVPTMSVEASDLTVHEDGLAGVGTHAGDPAHPVIHEGLLAVSSAETLATIEVGGLVLNLGAVDGSGNVAFTNSGTESVTNGNFSVTSIVKSGDVYTLHYSYTLTDHAAHPIPGASETADSTALPLTITVTDATGDSVSDNFVINILDDAPVIRSVTDPSVTLHWHNTSYTMEAGTVDINFGADGLALLQVTDKNDASKSISFTEAGTQSIAYDDGSIMSVTVNAAGKATYAYTPGNMTNTTARSFAFTGTDSDGDSIGRDIGVKVSIYAPDDQCLNPAHAILDESALPTGTNQPGDDNLFISTTVAIPVGFTLNTTGWTAGVGVMTLSVEGGKGLLVYDTTSHQLTYTLTGPYTHPDPTNADEQVLPSLSDVTLTLSLIHDATGQQGNGILRLDIEDDAPIALDDVHVLTTTAVQTGNVISGVTNDGVANDTGVDTRGADDADVVRVRAVTGTDSHGNPTYGDWVTVDPTTGGTVSTANGTLTLHSDGSYTYSPTIVYETIIGGEAGYPGSSNSWKQSGTFNGYTFGVVRVEGDDTVLGNLYHPVNNSEGQFDIEGQGVGAGMGVKGGDGLGSDIDGANAAYDEGVLITPLAGAPAMAISFSELGAGEAANWVAYGADGSVIGSGVFAGGAGATLIIGQGTVSGTIHNVLVYAGTEDTSFRIQEIAEARVASVGDQDFQYELKDGDGDTDPAILSFTSAVRLKLIETTTDTTVDEANLPAGTEPDTAALTRAGVIAIDHASRDFSLSVGHGAETVTLTRDQLLDLGTVDLADRTVHDTGGKGLLVITGYDEATGKVAYQYTMSASWQDHTVQGQDDIITSNFSVHVTDTGSGASSAGTLVVTIVDDAPVLSSAVDPSTTLQWQATAYTVESGNVEFNYGADGFKSISIVDKGDASKALTFTAAGTQSISYADGSALSVTVDAAGKATYTYTPGNMTVTTDRGFAFTGTDNDGDTASKDIAVKLSVFTPGDQDLTPAHAILDESALATGTNQPGDDNLFASTLVTIPTGFALNTTGWTAGSGVMTLSVDGGKGLLTYNTTTHSLTYGLTAAHTHPNALDADEQILGGTDVTVNLSLTHIATGQAANASLRLDVEDDAPTLTVTDTVDTVTGTDPITVGTWVHAFGADQPLNAAANIAVSLDGTHYVTGTFVPASGSVGAHYSFNVAGDAIRLYTNHDVTFQSGTDRAESNVILHIKVTDADGDTVIGATAIQFDLEPSRLVLTDIDKDVQESALGPNVGVGVLPGTNPDATDEYSNSGAWVKLFTPAELLAGITVDKAALEAHYGSNIIESGNFLIIAGAYGELKINLTDQTYRYELTHATMHDTATPGSGAGLEKDNAETFTLFAKDTSGKTGDLSLRVDIHDDAPVLDVQGTGIHNLGTNSNFVFSATGSVALNYGADGPDDPHGATVPVRLNWFNDKVTGADITGSSSVDVPLNGSWISVNTAMGVLSLSYNNNVLQYSYLAKRGDVNDNEQITLSVTDGDKDIATDNINFHLLYKVPAGTVSLDEAGITVLGSHHDGFAPSTGTFSLDAGQIHPNTTSITWHTGTVSSTLMADSNDNGTYEAVTWTQVGNTLLGHASGVLVMQVVPQFVSGTFTGNFSAELFKPVQHATGADALGLLVGLKQNTGSGGGLETAIGITVMDDRPEARIEPVTTQEAIVAQENVYLVIDDSGSMNQSEVQQELNALKGLVQKYIDLGIEARFTYVEFSTSATVLTGMDGLTAAQMLTKLNAITATAGSGNTNYRDAVNLTMSQMTEDLTNPDLHSMKKTVYFVSDGEPTVGSGSDGWVPDAWNQYVKDNNVNVVALGVGIASGGLVNLQDVASTALVPTNQAILVDNFSNLLAALTGTVTSTANGNILGVDTDNDDTRSADHTTVDAVNVSGTWVAVAAGTGGTTIDLGNGIHLTLWQNGDYKISASQNLSADVTLNLEYRIKDADGDTSENSLSIIVKDSAPQAFDNVGTLVTETITPAHQNLEVFTGSSLTGAGWTVYGSAASNQAPPSTLPDIAGTSDSANRTVALTANGGNLNTTGVLGTATVQSIVGTASTDGAAIAKSFTLGSAGEIQFNWLLQNGRQGQNYDRDAGFWVLKNAGGAVVQTGLLAQAGNQQYYSGTQTITVGAAGTYTLVLAVVDIANGATDRRDAMLYVDDIIFAPAAYSVFKYEGNVLDDPGVDGSVDVMADHAKLHSFDYAGQTYVFGVASSITTVDGKFTMSNVGDYTFKDSRTDIDDVNISYTLRDQDGDTDSGMLFIRSSGHMFMGTAGNDTIDGSLHTANNLYSGGAGNDLITGGSGHDALYGGAGNDTLRSGAGHDRLVGGEGHDSLVGGIGNDSLFGGNGNDALDGGVGNDLLRGGAGNDVLRGGTGNDTMMGGTGADTFEWGTGDLRTGTGNLAVVQDFTLGEDRLHFQDILGAAEPTMANVLTKLRLAAGSDDKMDITINSTHEAVVTIGNDTVQVNLEGAGLSAATVTAIGSGDEDAKAQLLLHLLTTN